MKWKFDKYLILESEQRQKRHALRVVLGIGMVLTALKFGAFALTDSTAVLSDALESVINLAAGFFALWSFYYASRPRDSRHPYGHGKIESLAATAEGSLIFAVGAVIFGKAIYNLVYPHRVGNIDIGIAIIAGTAVVNYFLGVFLLRRAKKFDSLVLKTDGKRLLMDAYSSAALVGGLFILYFTGLAWVDSLLAMLSGVLVIRTGYRMTRISVKGLLDAADMQTLQDVVNVLQANSRPEWIDIQNVRTSHHGMYMYIDCHLTLPWYWNLQKVNEQVREAEYLINRKFKERVELFVQAEPCKPRNCPQCRILDCPVRQHPYNRQSAKALDLTPAAVDMDAPPAEVG